MSSTHSSSIARLRAQLGSSSELTPRELEVMQHIANGMTNPEVGRSLFLSEETVKGYVKTSLRKLDAGNRTHAVALLLRAGSIL